MGSKNSKSESPNPEENVFISYYCDHLVNQKKINYQTPVKGVEIESFKNVYDYRKKSIKKRTNSIGITSKNKI
jgi:hypothetical protein